jgi:signal transduction histidine kinase
MELNFDQALEQLTASMSGTDSPAPELDIKKPVLSFITPQLEEHLLNIAREALSNSMRHAHASRRWVRLSLTDGAIRLVIGDDGVGFIPRRRRRTGHGLSNMAARAKQILATFMLDSAPGHGTAITVDVPLKKGIVYE